MKIKCHVLDKVHYQTIGIHSLIIITGFNTRQTILQRLDYIFEILDRKNYQSENQKKMKAKNRQRDEYARHSEIKIQGVTMEVFEKFSL